MDVFDDNFQEFISEKLDKAYEIINEKEKWDELNNEYDQLHHLLYNSLNEDQLVILGKLLTNIHNRANIDICLGYMLGMADKTAVKKFEIKD